MRLITGDKVIIIAGKDRGKTGLIEKVIPKDNKVVVTGLNQFKRHLKKTTKNPQGGIVTVSRPIQASNVMLLDSKTNKPTRIGYKFEGDKKYRLAKTSQEVIVKEAKK